MLRRLVMPSRLATLFRLALRGVVFAVLAAGLASAQTFDFQLEATENGQAASIANNATLPFLTTVGTTETATVTATYIGASQATISQPPVRIGSNEFSVTSNLVTPEVLTPGEFFTLTITFSPTNPNGAGGVITVNYTEPPVSPSTTPVQGSIVINLVGQSPDFTLGYILETTKNFVSISSGGTIPFGATLINTMAAADLVIDNLGSGEGVITGITSTPAGSPFQVAGIPQFPAGVPSGMNLTLFVTYTPTAVENDNASIQITFQGGVTETVNFSGNGVTSTFTYQVLIPGKPATPVAPNGTITFPGANVGSSSNLILKVTNTGSASGTINSISTNPPFTLTSPITLPVTLTTGNSFSVPLTFTPTQVQTQTGYLVVGNATFTLKGSGLGPSLTYSYTSSGVTTTVDPATGGAVFFNPVAVGQSESVTFTITNSGSLPATISLVEPSSANGIFTVSPIALPKVLAPSLTLSFPITFTPTTTGLSTGTLLVNTTPIPLDGSASAPVALPSYTISGPSGTVQPATQSNISLTLAKAYSLDLTGTLTLTTEGSFGTDPAVQFTVGGRTVDFTIAANSTSADFAGQGSEIPLQTGTVAETVTLAPTFTTAGGANVTPSSPTTLQFTVPSEAPVLEYALVTDETPISFNLVLTGYSTIRSLSSLNVTFTPATGFNIGTAAFTFDISQASAAWFSTTASESLGGLFQITETFTLQGTVKVGQTLIESIASVTATVSNSIGTSGSAEAPVQ
jgi:hypothetical protein